jgi:hypothetical protein
LFDALLAEPWTQEVEDDAVKLLTAFGDDADATSQRAARVLALYRLTDRMVAARFQALMKDVEHPEKLTRTELAKKREDNQKKAREGFVRPAQAGRGRAAQGN